MLPPHRSLRRPLEVVTTYGCPTTWQVSSALTGLPGDAISLAFHSRVVAKLQRLERDGWVTIEPMLLPSRTLLHLAGMQYRSSELAHQTFWDLPDLARRIIDFTVLRGDWVDERELVAGCLQHIATPGNRRRALNRLVKKGVLTRQQYGDLGYFDVVRPTPRGWRYLRGGKFRAPDERHIRHAVLTIEASLLMQRGRPDTSVVTYEWDEMLRSRQRLGRDSSQLRGQALGLLPDAELVLRGRDGREEGLVIELLTSGYSDAAIRDKHSGLPTGTIFFVETKPLAERVRALTGRSPTVLPRMTYACPTLRT